jgi:hypothetical protein
MHHTSHSHRKIRACQLRPGWKEGAPGRRGKGLAAPPRRGMAGRRDPWDQSPN